MAVHIHPPLSAPPSALRTRAAQFRRKDGRSKPKKLRRKIRLRAHHILLSFLFLTGLFFAIQQLYLFLISWERLNVTEIDVICNKPEITGEISRVLSRKNIGNILLLDIRQLQDSLAEHRWIRKVRVKKIFPSSLRVEIEERIPIALLKKDSVYLIDREGIELEKASLHKRPNLPLLIDTDNFKRDYSQKMELAWALLDALSPEENTRIDILDLSEYKNLSLRFKESSTWLILGNDRYAEKLGFYHKSSSHLTKFGALEYIDLRFQGRLILKPLDSQRRDIHHNSQKEVN
jgi:cell division septal protein FtsQ